MGGCGWCATCMGEGLVHGGMGEGLVHGGMGEGLGGVQVEGWVAVGGVHRAWGGIGGCGNVHGGGIGDCGRDW